MESMIAAISGQFTKALILGALFPVVLFVLLGIWLLAPLLPAELGVLQLLNSLDRQWYLFALSFLVVLISGFLYNLNVPIIRLYEGYPWRFTAIGDWFAERREADLKRLETAFTRLRGLRENMRKRNTDFPFLADVNQQLSQTARIKFNYYPEAGKVLPTRLGNVIRSFEQYPSRQYGISSVTLWSRIIGVAPKDYVSTADEAKISLDFFLNSSFLSALFALALLLFGTVFHRPFFSRASLWPWLLELGFFALLARLCYEAAIVSAASWGEQVKGIFDLYRFALLKALGYTQVPRDRREERALWLSISTQMIYGDPDQASPRPYADAPPAATVITPQPSDTKTQVLSGVQPNATRDRLTYLHQVVNLDSKEAEEIEIQQKLDDGFVYEWESAEVGGAKVAPSSTAPLSFRLGRLQAGTRVLFKFSAFRIKPPESPDGSGSGQAAKPQDKAPAAQ